MDQKCIAEGLLLGIDSREVKKDDKTYTFHTATIAGPDTVAQVSLTDELAEEAYALRGTNVRLVVTVSSYRNNPQLRAISVDAL